MLAPRDEEDDLMPEESEGKPGLTTTLNVSTEGAVLFAESSAPPMNLLGPELVRDLVSLIRLAEADIAADLAERYGWINRALPADALGDFVRALAHRIAASPAAGHAAVKDRVNAISPAPLEDFRRDSDRFRESVGSAETQRLPL
jgi:enoyl-CoA hydratase/carnithine racemase